MSEAIKVGDLVMVVRTCCDFPIQDGVRLGLPWSVHVVATLTPGRCPNCGFTATRVAGSREIKREGWNCAPLEWLKKIDPPAQDETTDQPEELTA